MPSTTQSIDVNVPISTAYNQYTQFEDFPQFMEGVKSVTQLDDTHLRWVTEVGDETKEWTAEITEQKPDERIAWQAQGDVDNAGIVTFHAIDADSTRVTAEMTYETDGLKEAIGDALGFVDRRVKGDLERFKEFLEARGSETGAWRGEVEAGVEVNSDDASGTSASLGSGSSGPGATTGLGNTDKGAGAYPGSSPSDEATLGSGSIADDDTVRSTREPTLTR